MIMDIIVDYTDQDVINSVGDVASLVDSTDVLGYVVEQHPCPVNAY